MNKSELIEALATLADDVDICVGDPDTFRYWEPDTVSPPRFLWSVPVYNALDGKRWTTYFDYEADARNTYEHYLENGWEPVQPVQVLCLKI